jgi:ribonuclease-3
MRLSWRRFSKIFHFRDHGVIEPNAATIAELEQKCGYHFRDPNWMRLALVHRSFLNGAGSNKRESNERLEFLGDAILGLLVTEHLFHLYSNKSEGVLTKYKSVIVSRKTLARRAQKLGLGKYLYLGQGEDRSGGRERESILSDAFEALLGAIYVDGGYGAVKSFLVNHLFPDLAGILKKELHRNYKSQLLEYSQARGLGLPRYEIQLASGPEHDKSFEVGVRIGGEILGVGRGKSKKKAEQDAAQKALERIE